MKPFTPINTDDRNVDRQREEADMLLLDTLDSDVSCDAAAPSPLPPDTALSSSAQILTDIDEAMNLGFGGSVDIDDAWRRFSSDKPALSAAAKPSQPSLSRRRYAHWGITVTVAAATILLFFTLRPQTSIDAEAERLHLVTKRHGVTREVEQPAKLLREITVADVEMNELTAPAGGTLSAVLPDGTAVTLNANSRLRYPTTFSNTRREVSVVGEVYFDVTHDAAHPFVIRTSNVTARVLGTQLNVRCYDTNDVHVTLVKGKVEVGTEYGTVTISPNQDVSISETGMTVADVNPKDFTSWRDGIMYFDRATMRTILQQLAGWYDASIVCKDDEMLDRYYHFMFDTRSTLKDAVKLLEGTSDCTIRLDEQNKTIILDGE